MGGIGDHIIWHASFWLAGRRPCWRRMSISCCSAVW